MLETESPNSTITFTPQKAESSNTRGQQEGLFPARSLTVNASFSSACLLKPINAKQAQLGGVQVDGPNLSTQYFVGFWPNEMDEELPEWIEDGFPCTFKSGRKRMTAVYTEVMGKTDEFAVDEEVGPDFYLKATRQN
jgi:hypothetical protein